MAGTTPNLGFPYPEYFDTNHAQDDIQALAAAVDTWGNTLAGRVNTPPMCIVKWSGTGTITIATGGAAVPWDTDVFDPLGWHDPVTNNSRITPNIAGWYLCITNFQFSGNSTGRRAAPVRVNGTNLNYGDVKAAGTASNVGAQEISVLPFNGTTDYAEVFAFQDSGSSLTCGDSASSRFSMNLLYRT